MNKATFAAGCFWGVEARFQEIDGVTDTRVGYIGGVTTDPSYKDICRGDTNHAEAVEVSFDPERVSYDDLLEAFWSSHNPTTLNRQGPDLGTQYRSAIFTHSEEQADQARNSMREADASGRFNSTIVTQITQSPTFFEAEEYHQSYIKKKQGTFTCKMD